MAKLIHYTIRGCAICPKVKEGGKEFVGFESDDGKAFVDHMKTAHDVNATEATGTLDMALDMAQGVYRNSYTYKIGDRVVYYRESGSYREKPEPKTKKPKAKR